MELWDLYDREKHPLGRTIERGKTLGAEEYHLAVNVLSVNAEGRLLITKRHPAKSHGGLWEISGGRYWRVKRRGRARCANFLRKRGCARKRAS